MKSHWIEHKSKRIFYADYSGFGNNTDALYQEISQAIGLLAGQPEKSTLVLANTEKSDVTVLHANIFKELLHKSNPSVRKRAIVGLSSAGQIFVTTLSNIMSGVPVRVFHTRENALDWLIAE